MSITHKFHEPVTSCEDAARVRGVPLHEELKTLLLKDSRSIYAVHLRASDKLHSRILKNRIRSKYLRFLFLNELDYYGLEPGTINPWNADFCDIHYICRKVFRNTVMTTNNGYKTVSIFFPTVALLLLPSLEIGDFGVGDD